MSSQVPRVDLPSLAPNTIIPENESLFDPYFIQLYEEIAFAVNSKDYSFFPIPVTSNPSNIPNIPNFGSFLVTISGTGAVQDGGTNYLPTLTVALNKSDPTVAGVINALGSQAGTGPVWGGATLSITSTATNFQINHSVAGKTGNFNIRIVSSQP